jgi:hypothetical protein
MTAKAALFFGSDEHLSLAKNYAASHGLRLVESAAPSLALLLNGSFYGFSHLLFYDMDAAAAVKHMGTISDIILGNVTVVLLRTGREFTSAERDDFLHFAFESATREVRREELAAARQAPPLNLP